MLMFALEPGETDHSQTHNDLGSLSIFWRLMAVFTVCYTNGCSKLRYISQEFFLKNECCQTLKLTKNTEGHRMST